MVCVLSLGLRAQGQQSGQQKNDRDQSGFAAAGLGASNEASRAGSATHERVTDEPRRPGAGRAVARIPLYPLIGLGKAFEKAMLAVEEKNLIQKQAFALEWLAERHMVPLFGGMGTGTGLALGINFFDRDFLGSKRLRWEMPLQISTANYRQFETRVQWALLAERRLFLEGYGRYRNRPQEDFFGLGPHSRESDRSNFKLQDRTAGVSLGAEFGPGRRVSVDVLYVNAKPGDGTDQEYPDTDTLFPTLAGLAGGSALLKYGVTAEVPWLDHAGDPHRGVRFRMQAYRVDSRHADNFNFNEYRASGEFYVPLGGPRMLAIRALGDFRDARNGGSIPFYALPFLGGSRSMRGFREFRFYDNHAVLFNVEYRWKIWKLADAVLFVDEGQVAPRVSGMTLDGYRSSYGGGIRLKGAKGTGLRFDVGHSREGTRCYFSFGPEW
jgi:outer membrane protein assembly factor BamA